MRGDNARLEEIFEHLKQFALNQPIFRKFIHVMYYLPETVPMPGKQWT